MEELYRYVLLRPAEAVDPSSRSDIIDLSGDDAFQASLRSASDQDERRRVSRDYIESDVFFDDPRQVPHGPALMAVADRYLGTPVGTAVSADDVTETLVSVLTEADPELAGPDTDTATARRTWLGELADTDDWNAAEARLKASVLAIRESSGRHPRSLAPLADLLRAMRLVSAAAKTEGGDLRPGAILQASFYLPDVREREIRNDPSDADVEEDPELERKRREYARLTKATEELIRAPLSQMDAQEEVERTAPQSTDRTDEGGEGVRVVRKVRLGQAYERLSEETREVLRDLELDPASEPLDAMVEVVRSEQWKSTVKLRSGPGKRIAGTRLSAVPKGPSLLGKLDFLQPPILPPVPQTTGNVSPVGVGDLLLVQQHLKRYEGGDIAHVENILRGELKEREHRRRRLSETTFVTETETEVSEERETQSTSRYEMRLEVQNRVDEEFGVDAGVKVSASYGPVQMEANTEFAYKNAKSEARNRATSQSRELVEKAATEYREKVREQTTRRLVEEVEELNRHRLDATGFDEHVAGMYQWLNKIYEAGVFDYGIRVMYDFMLPEPAAWFIWSLSQQTDGTEALKVPPTFELDAADIDEDYEELVALYEAVDVPPPPEPFITVSVQKSGGPNPEKGPFVDSDMATIPDGYEYYTHVQNHSTTSKTSDPTKGFDVVVPSGFTNPGTVPVLFSGYSLTGWTAFVQIQCRRTDRSMEAWRNKVWEALHQGHQQQVARYEEKLGALLAQAGVVIQGRNPYTNRRIEQGELKKGCITMLTGTHLGWVNAVKDTEMGPVPATGVAKFQGVYVRFMEQAFEWENMAYVYHPYFWARQSRWRTLMEVQDEDPAFQEFLTSGFARVVVPVRPGFESAVEHFRQTGEVWSGGKLPVITDPDYLPIAEELKARLDAPGEEEPVGEPWEVLVPTQLVKLRMDDALPRWEKQPDGSWTEV